MQTTHRLPGQIHNSTFLVTIHGILLDPNDIEICDALCRKCNALAIFENGKCECSSSGDISDEECIRRLQREIQIFHLSTLSNNFANKKRSVRSILKSRHRLRTEDGEKVAQYFINGGPLVGHSHFVKKPDEDYGSADSAANFNSHITREGNPDDKSTGTQSQPLVTSFSFGGTQDSPSYMTLKRPPMILNPALPNMRTYIPTLSVMNPIFGHPMNALYNLPGSTYSSLKHPSKMQNRRTPLYILPRIAAFPSFILQNARYSSAY